MGRRTSVFIVALLMLLTAAGATPFHTLPASAAPSLQAESSLSLTVTSEQPVIVEQIEDGQRYLTFENAASALNAPGTPALPTEERLIALPAGVTPTLAVTLAPTVALPAADAPLLPVPSMKLPDGLSPEEAQWVEPVYEMQPDLATAGGWYPAAPVRLSETMTVRGQTMVRLEYTTVQVNLATGELRWLPEVAATVAWEAGDARLPASPASDPAYDALLDQMVVNPDQARAWRLPTGGAPEAMAVNPQWRVTVQGKGLYRIPFSGMAGVNAGNAARLAVFFGPLDAPVQQAVLQTTDSLYLVNNRDPGFWSNDIVYRVELLPEGQSGLRMGTLPGTPSVGLPLQTFLPLAMRNGAAGASAPLSVPESVESPAQWTASVPYELRVEQNKSYSASEAATRPGERWHWTAVSVTDTLPERQSELLTFDAPDHDSSVGLPVTIRSEMGPLYSSAASCRTVRLTVNDNQVATRTWTGSTAFGQLITMPASALKATGNSYQYKVTLCPSYTNDRILLNAFIVRYQRFLKATNDQMMFESPADIARTYGIPGFTGDDIQGFELSTPSQPRLITGGLSNHGFYLFGRPAASESYLVARLGSAPTLTPAPYVPSGLRGATAHADYIVIAPSEFHGALAPLISRIQSSRGQTVRLIRTTDIYNDFGVGVMDPAAIRDFLEFAYTSWVGPAPAYVLLVGDGNYDPKNYMGNSLPNFVPPIFVTADAFLDETPGDNAYVSDLAPGSTDNLPDMHIGRLPAGSIADVTTMVTKLNGYESSTPAGTWRRQVSFVADDADSAGNFPAYSDALAPLVRNTPKGTVLSKIYLPDGAGPTQILQARDQIVSRLNDGELILQYVGHAGHAQWASGAGGLWAVRRGATGYGDLDLLSPSIGYRQPVNLPWACWDGYFVHPDSANQAVSEVMVRTYSNRGSIASFSPTGLDLASAHDLLAQGFLGGLYGTGSPPPTPQTELGALTLMAKLKVANTSYARLIDTYLLIGEPGMKIARDPCTLNNSCTP